MIWKLYENVEKFYENFSQILIGDNVAKGFLISKKH